MGLVGAAALLLVVVVSASAHPFYATGHRGYLTDLGEGGQGEGEADPELVLQILTRLGQTIVRASDMENEAKRGLDLGLSRGFSGSQAAKHLMGLAAANYAGGPGRRRR